MKAFDIWEQKQFDKILLESKKLSIWNKFYIKNKEWAISLIVVLSWWGIMFIAMYAGQQIANYLFRVI